MCCETPKNDHLPGDDSKEPSAEKKPRRNVVPILQLVVSALGLLSLLGIYYQIRQNTRLNSFNYVDVQIFRELEKDLFATTKKLGINLRSGEPVTPEEAQEIAEDDDALFAVKAYLTNVENLALAVEIGAVDEDIAYRMHSVIVIQAYDVFRSFIDRLRKTFNENDIYRDLETIAERWKEREARQRKQ